MTLGTYPATSLAGARTKAQTARADLETGKNPQAALRKPDTLRVICEEYFAREGAALRSVAQRTATLKRLVYPTLGDRPINEVRRSDITRMLDRIEDECGPVMADRTLAYLRRALNWHEGRSDDFRSPIVRDMARTKPSERQRERVLADEELRRVWRASEAGGLFGCFVRFLLLTGARRNEAARMTWPELDGGDWTLPAARNKTKADLVRPLSAAAIAALPPRRGAFVFTTDGATPISGFSKLKSHIDKAAAAGGEALARWTLCAAPPDPLCLAPGSRPIMPSAALGM
jgi:integrase